MPNWMALPPPAPLTPQPLPMARSRTSNVMELCGLLHCGVMVKSKVSRRSSAVARSYAVPQEFVRPLCQLSAPDFSITFIAASGARRNSTSWFGGKVHRLDGLRRRDVAGLSCGSGGPIHRAAPALRGEVGAQAQNVNFTPSSM